MIKKYKFADFVEWRNSNGEVHRINGPAREYVSGDKSWYYKDNLHRKGGPAIEWSDGQKSWFIHGKLHREDGPAIELPNGYKAWYLNGLEVTEEEFLLRTHAQVNSCTIEDKVIVVDGKKYKLVPCS